MLGISRTQTGMSQGACGYYVGLFLLKNGFWPPLPGAPPACSSELRRVLGLLGGAADISVLRLKPTRAASSVIPSQNKTYELDVPWQLNLKMSPKLGYRLIRLIHQNSFARCRLCYSHDVIAALACSANASVVTARGT